jgi:hypothetical protein
LTPQSFPVAIHYAKCSKKQFSSDQTGDYRRDGCDLQFDFDGLGRGFGRLRSKA